MHRTPAPALCPAVLALAASVGGLCACEDWLTVLEAPSCSPTANDDARCSSPVSRYTSNVCKRCHARLVAEGSGLRLQVAALESNASLASKLGTLPRVVQFKLPGVADDSGNQLSLFGGAL